MTFTALVHSPDHKPFLVGFGCHLDARLALQRALTELNQLFDPNDESAFPWDADAIEDPAYLFPDETVPARSKADYVEIHNEDLLQDIELCVERAREADLETLVLNQTRPDVGIAAVKVIVPGLRNFWPRLGPGRLYEVPAQLGWLDRALDERELNPIPIYL